MTLRLTASLIALSFLAGGAICAPPASADEYGYRTRHHAAAPRAPRITIRNTSRYDEGYAAGMSVGTSYARGYTDGLAAAQALEPPAPPDVTYDPYGYEPPVYAYGPTYGAVYGTTTVVDPAYAYRPPLPVGPAVPVAPVAPALEEPVVSAYGSAGPAPAATAAPVAETTAAVHGDVAVWMRNCKARYRRFAPSDFDPSTGTFLGNDGDRYYCN